MNKYNQLREEIIRICPDILELKFGCKYKNIHGSIHSFINNAGRDQHRYLIVKSDNGMTNNFGQTLNIFIEEIIGRDITPIDILKTRNDLAIDSLGGIFIRNHCNEKGDLWEMEYCGHYDIGKPLQDQSDETLTFLHELICKDG